MEGTECLESFASLAPILTVAEMYRGLAAFAVVQYQTTQLFPVSQDPRWPLDCHGNPCIIMVLAANVLAPAGPG